MENKKVKKARFNLDHYFTDPEKLDLGKDLSLANREKKEIEDKKKEAMSSFKYQFDGKEAQINLLPQKLQNGYEIRQVLGDVEYNYDKGEKKYLYEGKVVDTKKMTQEDYQLEFEEPKN